MPDAEPPDLPEDDFFTDDDGLETRSRMAIGAAIDEMYRRSLKETHPTDGEGQDKKKESG